MGPQGTEELYREHGAAVAAFCGSLLHDRAEAEDAAQQVFLSAHRALLNGSAPREPLAWLLTVARHECYARFRQRAAAAVPADEVPDGAAPDASVQAVRAGELETVWDEVGRMPPAQREAFLLREVRGLSYGQLADELSLSRPSVRSLLLRARTRLRHRLRDVAAGLGGAPWIQALVRAAGSGDGASPVPAATKAAAVGIGALALMGGGDVALTPRHVSRPSTRSAEHRRAQPRPIHVAGHVAEPAAVAVGPAEDRPSSLDDRGSVLEHSRSHDDSGSRRSSDDRGTSSPSSSGEGSSDGGDHGSTTAVVTQPTTDGRDSHDGGSSPSTGTSSDAGSGTSSSDASSGSSHDSGSGSDGGSDGSGDGSDGGFSSGPGG